MRLARHLRSMRRTLGGEFMKRLELNLPTFGFVVVTRAALGVGIGLLLSNRLPPERRRVLGLALVGVGAATTIPAALAVFRGIDSSAPKLNQ
jgi:hypothetical protein